MLKKMRPLAYMLLVALALTSCGPALDDTGAVKDENVSFEGTVMGHKVYYAQLPSGSSVYFIDDGSAIARPGKYPDYSVIASSSTDDIKTMPIEDLIARRKAIREELRALDAEIGRRSEMLQGQVELLKRED